MKETKIVCMNCGDEKVHNIIEKSGKRINGYEEGFEKRKRFLEFVGLDKVEWTCCGRCCLTCKDYSQCFSS